jgi:hypothetical protein
MTTVTDQLVARAAELDSLDTAIAGLERGGPAALVLLVELGIRQTSLLGEFAARADALGHIVLSGRASEVEGDLPFWLFVDALDEFVAGVDPCRLESLGDDLLTELARVLPSLSDLARPGEPALQGHLRHSIDDGFDRERRPVRRRPTWRAGMTRRQRGRRG